MLKASMERPLAVDLRKKYPPSREISMYSFLNNSKAMALYPLLQRLNHPSHDMRYIGRFHLRLILMRQNMEQDNCMFIIL